MTLTLEQEIPPLREDATGAIRVGNTRVLLELVIRAFQDGASQYCSDKQKLETRFLKETGFLASQLFSTLAVLGVEGDCFISALMKEIDGDSKVICVSQESGVRS